MMTTGSPSDPGRGKVYIGRVRGLRQGGGRRKMKTSGPTPPINSGPRFNNIKAQLSKRPGPPTSGHQMAPFVRQAAAAMKRKRGG